VSSSSNSLS
jgi:hypothetical protein